MKNCTFTVTAKRPANSGTPPFALTVNARDGHKALLTAFSQGIPLGCLTLKVTKRPKTKE